MTNDEQAPERCDKCGEYLLRIEESNHSLYSYQWNAQDKCWEQVEHEDGEINTWYACDNCES